MYGFVVSDSHRAYPTAEPKRPVTTAMEPVESTIDRDLLTEFTRTIPGQLFEARASRTKYSYDDLHRLAQVDIGRFNDTPTSPALLGEWDTPQQIEYTMDILGNITTLDRKNSGSSASESRTYNATNELVSRTVAAAAPIYWVDDDYADNDTTGYEVADLDPNGADGSWSASNGQLQNDTVVAITNAPGNGDGSILLADVGAFNDVRIRVDVTLSSTAENGGIVFGYQDEYNFWILIANRANQKYDLYEVTGSSKTGRTFNYRVSRPGTPISSSGGTYTLNVDVRSGGVAEMPTAPPVYYATIPAGRIGLWSGSGSASVKFDDFEVLDLGMPKEVDGRWFEQVGNTALSSGKLQFNVVSGGAEKVAIRRGFRGDKYVLEYDHDFVSGHIQGAVVHYQDAENFMAVVINPISGTYVYPKLCKREDGVLSSVATGTPFTITSGDTVRCVIGDDPNTASLQELRVYVAGTQRMATTTIDDTWSAGRAGLYAEAGATSALTFDNFKCGFDNNSDDDIVDAGDDQLVSDDFASSTISLSYDNNGNLSDDGVYEFVYDAWNHLRKVQFDVSSDITTIAEYEYYGDNRRSQKTIQNCGDEVVENDGGDTAVMFYYDNKWRIVEMRDGSNQTTYQYLWGTRYTDELIWIEKNGDPTESNDTNPDDQTSESTADARYFVHQDRNWNVVALSEYDTGDTNNGRIVERYSYTPYGSFVVLKGDSGDGELGNAGLCSSVGNPFTHQGLVRDSALLYNNRLRIYSPLSHCFNQPDILGYVDGMNLYSALLNNPVTHTDSYGNSVDPDAICEALEDAGWTGWGKTVCDGEGGQVSCVNRCRMPGTHTPYRCPNGYDEDDPCPNPPDPALCDCNGLLAACVCRAEKEHIDTLSRYPNACRHPNGDPRAAGSDPVAYPHNPKKELCTRLISEIRAHQELINCLEDHGGDLECAKKVIKNARKKINDYLRLRRLTHGW